MSGTNIYLPGKWKSQTFTSSGTFTVPNEVEAVFVEMVGGGGGGGQGPTTPTGGFADHAFGGEGAQPVQTFVAVTPGASVTVTIGSGGAGASTQLTGGASGGNSSFGALIARGARGGTGGLNNNGGGNGWGIGRNGYRGTGGAGSMNGLVPATTTPQEFGGDGSYGNGGAVGVDGGIGAGGGGNSGGPAGDGGNGICVVWWKVD